MGEFLWTNFPGSLFRLSRAAPLYGLLTTDARAVASRLSLVSLVSLVSLGKDRSQKGFDR